MINYSSEQNHEIELPELKYPTRPLKYKMSSVHYQIDYSHSFFELIIHVKQAHFESFPKIHVFCVCTNFAHVVFPWKEQVGGKGIRECLHCLWILFTKYSTGAGHVTLAFDTAGQIWSQYLIWFMHFICSPQNPRRIFLDAELGPLEPGHSANGADLSSMLIDNFLSQLGDNTVLSFEDYIEWLKLHPTLIVEPVYKFLDIVAMLENSGIYKSLVQVKDLDGYIGNFGIRITRPLKCNLIFTNIYVDEQEKFLKRYHGNDAYFTIHFDPKKPKLRIRLLEDEYCYGVKEFEDPFQTLIMKEPCGLDRTAYENARDMVTQHYSKVEYAMVYWQNPENFILNDGTPIPPQNKVTVENLAEKEEDNILRYWNQARLVESAPKFVPCEREDGKKIDEFACKCIPQFTPKELSRAKYNELLDEIKIHKPLPQRGTKIEKFKRILSHYASVHDWSERDVNMAVELYKAKNKIEDEIIINIREKPALPYENMEIDNVHNDSNTNCAVNTKYDVTSILDAKYGAIQHELKLHKCAQFGNKKKKILRLLAHYKEDHGWTETSCEAVKESFGYS